MGRELNDKSDNFLIFLQEQCDIFLEWYNKDTGGFGGNYTRLLKWEKLCEMCLEFCYKTEKQLDVVISKLEIMRYNFILTIKVDECQKYLTKYTRKALEVCESTLTILSDKLKKRQGGEKQQPSTILPKCK